MAFLIPSLLVTLALQGQFFRVEYSLPPPKTMADRHAHLARAWTRTQRAAAVAMLGYLASGELASLYVLAAQDSSPLLFGVTAGAVVAAFIALAIVALIGAPRKPERDPGGRRSEQAGALDRLLEALAQTPVGTRRIACVDRGHRMEGALDRQRDVLVGR